MRRNRAPAVQRGEQAVDGRLQHRRMVAQLAGLADRLVDDRIERDDPADELASLGLRVRQLRPRQRQHAGKSARDLGRQIREGRCQPALGAAEIGAGENDAGAHDADADLAGAGDRQHEDLRSRASGRAERVGGDDRGRIAGERRRVGREVAQHRGDESAGGAPQRQSPRKAIRSCGKHAVSTTIMTAPTTVPIMRNQPLRSEAPSCGWHTIAAEVPAQNGLSSSSQNATKRARQTDAHSRTPKSSGAPVAVSASVNLPVNRGDAALVCIQLAPKS